MGISAAPRGAFRRGGVQAPPGRRLRPSQRRDGQISQQKHQGNPLEPLEPARRALCAHPCHALAGRPGFAFLNERIQAMVYSGRHGMQSMSGGPGEDTERPFFSLSLLLPPAYVTHTE